YAAWRLAELGDYRAVRFMIDLLDEPNPDDPNYPSSAARRAAQALGEIYKLGLLWDGDMAREAKKRVPADVKHISDKMAPARYLSFVLFDNAQIGLEQAETAFISSGANVKREHNSIMVDYGDGPRLQICLAQGESVLRQSKIIANIASVRTEPKSDSD